MTYRNVLVQRDGCVGVILVNRPHKANALNKDTMRELVDATDELASDPAVRVVIYSGAGGKCFVAGDDIAELNALKTVKDTSEALGLFRAVLDRVSRLQKPTIMAINGYALGAGFELALAGDIRIAADTARLGLPEINMGVIPGGYGTVRLPRLAGTGMAKYLIFTGRHISADEAYRIGIVEQVVPASDLMPTALALAQEIGSKSPLVLGMAKKTIDAGTECDFERAGEYEFAMALMSSSTEDRLEGTSAFLGKRKPIFKGR